MTDAVYLIQFLVFIVLFMIQLYNLLAAFFDNKPDLRKKAIDIKLMVILFITNMITFAIGFIAFLNSLDQLYVSLFLIQTILIAVNFIIFLIEIIMIWPMIVKLMGSSENRQAYNSKEDGQYGR